MNLGKSATVPGPQALYLQKRWTASRISSYHGADAAAKGRDPIDLPEGREVLGGGVRPRRRSEVHGGGVRPRADTVSVQGPEPLSCWSGVPRRTSGTGVQCWVCPWTRGLDFEAYSRTRLALH